MAKPLYCIISFQDTTLESFMRGPSPCVNDTDTESGHYARLGKIPLSPMASGGTASSRAVQQSSTLPQRLSPPCEGLTPQRLTSSWADPYPDFTLCSLNEAPTSAPGLGRLSPRWAPVESALSPGGEAWWTTMTPPPIMGPDPNLSSPYPGHHEELGSFPLWDVVSPWES